MIFIRKSSLSRRMQKRHKSLIMDLYLGEEERRTVNAVALCDAEVFCIPEGTGC